MPRTTKVLGMDKLKKNLLASPAARAKFLADILDTLGRNGVDVNDPKVVDSLDLHLDIAEGRKFVDSMASTNIITLVF